MDPETLLSSLGRVLRSVNDDDTQALLRAIREAPAVHLVGSGRSATIIRAFGASLTQLGFRAHVVGESTAPAFKEGELLVVCSGSGRAPGMLVVAERARQAGGCLALVTAAILTPLSRMAELTILLPPQFPSVGGTAGRAPPVLDEASLMFRARALFEQATFLYFELVAHALLQLTGQPDRDVEQRNPNLA